MDRGVGSQIALIQPDREMPKKLLSQLLFKHRPQHQNNNKRTPPFYCGPPAQWAPMCCLIFQRHHIAIELPIWFLTESQIGTSKVREKRQLSPGRRMLLPSSLS